MNYEYISDAINHYRARGYEYQADVPWTVEYEAYRATKPLGTKVIEMRVGSSDTKYPVASGEQSFIQLMLEGRTYKRAMCMTPCYRADKIDDLHRFNFMKLELINADDPSDGNLAMMIHDAASFFEKYIKVKIISTGAETFDIIGKASRVELGSYGIRRYKDLKWIYGTGCAEPRLSTVVERTGNIVLQPWER